MDNNLFNDDIDFQEYKKSFFAALKSPDVILSLGLAVIGIVIASCSVFASGRLRLIAMIAGFAITLGAGEMIRSNIRKHMGDNFRKE